MIDTGFVYARVSPLIFIRPMEKHVEDITSLSYHHHIEVTLNVREVMDDLEQVFDIFFAEQKKGEINELTILRGIKLFLYEQKEEVQRICRQSILCNFDCLTLAVITCLLAGRKGYPVQVGRPDLLSRYFHALIIRQNGETFKVAGREREYKTLPMNTGEVNTRLRYMQPAIRFIDLIKARVKSVLKTP